MKKVIFIFLLATSLSAQVQLGKGVQIGYGSGQGSGTVNGGTTGQVAQYPANGTAVQGTTVTGDATLANGGALTLSTVNSNPGNCGDATHVGQISVNGKGLTTNCTPVAITFPSAGATLKTNGSNNASQSLLNLISGTGITVANTSGGNITFTSTAPSPFSSTPGVVFNTSTTASRNAAFSDIVPLWGSGSCSGYLKSDGTCSTPSGAAFPGTNGIVFNTSTTAARNATVSDVGTLLSPLYTSTNYGFGDSTLDGVGCDVYANCFFGLLTAAHGGPSVNLGFGGQMASWTVVSMATNLNPGFITTSPQYSVLDDIGINDAAGCGGTNTLCQQNYSAAQNAAVAIGELTGTTYQTLAPACTLTGTWTSDTTSFAGGIYIGQTSTTNGDSMSCSITTTGNPIALEYVVHNSDAGTANCRVDSGSYQNINFFPYITLNNPVFTIFRSAEITAAAGTHTLNCIVTSATSASNPVEFIAVDSIPVGQTSTLPFFEMTNVISSGGTNDTASLDISNLVLPIVTAYQAEGANIVYADIRTPTNFPSMFSNSQVGCPTNTLNSSGGLHPNDCGHAAIAKAIMAAAPNIYQTNMGAKTQGVAPGPFQSWGQPIPSMKNSSGQSGGNFGAWFTTTGVNPGGWCVYANTCMLFANTGAQIVPGYSTNTPVLMLGGPGSPICFTGIPNTATLNSQLLPMRNCWSSNGDYYMYFPIGPSGTQVGSYFHPGFISRDNMISSSGSTPPSRGADVTFLGPYSGPFSISLGACKSAISGAENPWITFYRHGTDGNAITFVSSSSNGDNINGGSTGNTFVWTATEGDELTLQCSNSAVGGSYWTASVATTDASAISAGTLADARLSSNVPLVTMTNTYGAGTFQHLDNGDYGGTFGAKTNNIATSSANYAAGPFNWTSAVWNGSTSVQDTWSAQPVLGSGANPSTTLVFSHGSSATGPAVVSMPNLTTTVYTVTTLPSASSLPAGTQVTVSDDSGLPTSNTCTGSGTEYAIAITNGTSWTCH